jgi:hypothetical protein
VDMLFVHSRSGSTKLCRLINEAKVQLSNIVQQELMAARKVVIGLDCWSKKGLTAAFLGISASFFSTIRLKPLHILLSLDQLSNPYTGIMLADKFEQTLNKWSIPRNKILLVISDNGSNMVKAIKCIKLSECRSQGATTTQQEISDGDDSPDTESDIEVEGEEPESADVTDEHLIRGQSDDVEFDELDAKTGLTRLPCVAHTLQLVLDKS